MQFFSSDPGRVLRTKYTLTSDMQWVLFSVIIKKKHEQYIETGIQNIMVGEEQYYIVWE